MKILLATISLFISINSFAQINEDRFFSKADSIIYFIKNKDVKALLLNSTDTIRCYICNEIGKNQYIPSSQFFKVNAKSIFTKGLLERLKSSRKSLLVREQLYNAFVVFYEVRKKDEIAPGHEGTTLGIWLKEENGRLKFTAIETVP